MIIRLEDDMPAKVLSVTEAVRHFSDYVNRVAYRREAFVLRRGKMALVELRPVPSGRRLGDLPGILASLPTLSGSDVKAFGEDVRAARSSLRREKLRDPWAS
jgi:hypothetical protein